MLMAQVLAVQEAPTKVSVQGTQDINSMEEMPRMVLAQEQEEAEETTTEAGRGDHSTVAAAVHPTRWRTRVCL